jgi:hypothetical protein
MRKIHAMIRILFTSFILTCTITMSVPASAADLVVTRYFSGLWDQPHQESQGIVLQIIDQEEDGHKKAVAYWFTYGDDMATAWYMAIGRVEGDRVVMNLYTAEGVAFMEDATPGNESVYSVGTLVLWFHNCNKGIASYETEDSGGGEFEIKKLAGLYNSRCSGGISDDTPSNAKPLKMEVALEPARDGITGKGMAKFWERVDRSDFHVSAEGIPDGVYEILICESLENVGNLTVEAGSGETQFRSPQADSKELLSFDPRGCLIELHDGEGAALTSGDEVLAVKSNGNNGNGNGNGRSEIAVELDNTSDYPAAEGEASYVDKNNSVEFEVEIKGVPIGVYPLRVSDILRGEIDVADDGDDDSFKGKLRFSDPQKEQRELLDFDPRGQLIEVYDGENIIFDVYFPE